MPGVQSIQVIAHRGASGYLPEHTLPAKAMAHAQGADYLEQDVVLTRDGVPVVLHDIHLDTVTNVAHVFPDRQRDDGRYYAIDFALDEIRQLIVSERFHHKTGKAVFPHRFPAHAGSLRIPTLDEELTLIEGLNRSTGRTAGIYPEIKQPEFHRDAGQDISRIVLGVLKRHGYTDDADHCFVQCFDAVELRRIREELGCDLKLVQLWSNGDVRDAEKSDNGLPAALKQVAEYANGVGPSLMSLFEKEAQNGRWKPTGFVDHAHRAGLVVHPWTLRADDIPGDVSDFQELHRMCQAAGIDAVFSDFPDQSVQWFRERAR